MQDILYILFRLLRTAIGTQIPELSPNDQQKFQELSLEQWNRLEALAHKQGVAAVSFDGFQQICAANPDLDLIIQDHDTDLTIFNWNSHLAATERQYEQNANAIKQLSGLLELHGIKTMVFKGYSLSLEYPIPQHRECGDVDCFQYSIIDENGRQTLVPQTEEGDRIAAKTFNVKVAKGDKHNIFNLGRITVENHSMFLFTKRVPELKYAEEAVYSLAADGRLDSKTGCVVPSVQFNSLFLPLHFARHYVFRGSCLKQLLDWAIFVKNHKDAIHWEQLFSIAEQIGCRNFLESINYTIASQLGISKDNIPTANTTEADATRIINELICELPSLGGNLFHKLKKYRIWLRRYHTVYKGSLLRYFWLNYK